MKLFLRISAVILCASLSPMSLAAAEEPSAAPRTPARSWTAREALRPSTSPSKSPGAKGALIGAIVGGAGATGLVYWAAKTYGENEGGGFCGNCFAMWGAWAIPAGALGGAAIGYGIGKATSPQHAPQVPRTVVAPVVGRRGGGLVVTVRY
jgi:hypothetical protein